MTRPSTPPILSELRSPSSPATQVAALRALKNELIGHEQKKEMWIRLGVIAPIARILNTYKGNGKAKMRDTGASGDGASRRPTRTDEEEACLQAVIIVGILAHSGPAFLSPLGAGFVFKSLLSVLCPPESPPPLVLAALRALNAAADSVLLEVPEATTPTGGFLQVLYEDAHLTKLARILGQDSPALIHQQQISLAAVLIAKTCREEAQRKKLARTGVLEALAARLASFVVASYSSARTTVAAPIPDIVPASTRSRLSPILQAVGTIISNSQTRTAQFTCAPTFAALFSREADVDHCMRRTSDNRPTNRRGPFTSLGGFVRPPSALGPKESLSQASNFPPLGTPGSWEPQQRPSRGFSSALEITPTEVFNGQDEGDMSTLIEWLIHVVRAERGSARLMAAWVLILLCQSQGTTNKRRESGLMQLLVPLLVRMLDSGYKPVLEISAGYDYSPSQLPGWLIMEQAPTVLAMLVRDDLELQRAAVDAGAIKRLSQLLKQSYDPLPANSSSSMWTPLPPGLDGPATRENISTLKLGMPGLSSQAFHVLQMRESILIALAAMATAKDEYRRAIIDNGVVPYVIESLKPHHSGSSPVTPDDNDSASLPGNPTSVLIAACNTARALSRSVSTLRTSLIDAGLAAPLYVLLKYEDIEVQTAATAVVCNLVLEFSSMREAIIESGIIKVLCEHAHSVNVKLRLNSVWALKHLVHTAPNTLKINCLEELGPGWLKQIISSDDISSSVGHRGGDREHTSTPLMLGTPNAAGEQVDLLNAVDSGSPDPSSSIDGDEDEVNMIDSIGALSRPKLNPGDIAAGNTEWHYAYDADTLRSASLNAAELEAMVQARKENLAVQEQGLDFIRNIICGDGSPEMIDYVLRELGQDRFFDILASKLRLKMFDAYGRDRRAGKGVLHVPPHAEIIVSVCYIIVHIAAGLPRHRELLISQTELLKLLVPLFSHPSTEVRLSCTWIVINLTWTDDQSDKSNCRARAYELRKLGVCEKLEELESDAILDVRDKAKNALHQMTELLR